MKATIATILITAALVAGGMYALELRSASQESQAQKPLVAGELNRFTVAPTNTSVNCGTASGQVVATSSSRQYVALTNTSTTTNLFIALGKAAVSGQGIMLAMGGGSYEINQDNLFTGAITCIASSTAQLGVISI